MELNNLLTRSKKHLDSKVKENGYKTIDEFFTVNFHLSFVDMARKIGTSYQTISRNYARYLLELQINNTRRLDMASWYNSGFGALDGLPESKKQNRFFVKKNEEKKIIFLETEPFVFYEHQVTLNGEFKNYFTCLKNMSQPCPLCAEGIKSYFVGLFTVIEVGEWTDKEGKIHKNDVKIFAAKAKTLKLLRRHADKGRIKNGLFTAFRSDEKTAATCGDSFEFENTVNPFEFNPEAKPINFEELCAPLAEAKLLTIAKMAEPDPFDKKAGPAASSFGTTTTPSIAVDTDEVPF